MKRFAVILVGAGITMASIIAMAQGPIQGRGYGSSLTDEQRVERRVDRMKTQLNLTDAQTKDLKALYSEQMASQRKMQEAHRKAMEKYRAKCRGDVAKLLTPEQKALYDSLQTTYGQRYRNFENGSGRGCVNGDGYRRPGRHVNDSHFNQGCRKSCGQGYRQDCGCRCGRGNGYHQGQGYRQGGCQRQGDGRGYGQGIGAGLRQGNATGTVEK